MQNKKYKLIAFDVDGTILDGTGQVCDKLKKIVVALRDCGYLFTLVSARLPYSGLRIAAELGLHEEAIIVLNGSFITNQKQEILYSKTFPYSQVVDLLTDIDNRIVRNFYHEFDWVVNSSSPYTELEIKYIKSPIRPVVGNAPKYCNKITLMGDNKLLIEAQKALMNDDTLLAGFSHENYVEVTSKSISKFSGLSHYAKQKGINMDEIIAFGDGENDIPMLSNVGLGVAMGNAMLPVKLIAKDIASRHDEQGVANYLEALIEKNIL